MTLEEAVEIMKARSINGRSLLDGLEEVKHLWHSDEISDREKIAFRLVVNTMNPLFL